MKKAILPLFIGLALAGCKSETSNPEQPKPEPPPIPAPTDKAPVADNVLISGDAMIGNTLTLNYDFSDADGDVEHISTISWYITVSGVAKLISEGTPNTIELTGDAGVVGDVYATIKPRSDDGENKDNGVVVTSSPVRTYLAGDKPTVINTELLAPKAIADGVEVSAFYEYSDADGDQEADGGAEFKWVNRNDGQVLGTSSSLVLPANSSTMDIEVEIVAKSISNDDGAHGKPTGEPVILSLNNDVAVHTPKVFKLRTATAGWGDNVYIIKNMRNQLLLARAEYVLNAHDQMKISKADIYKLSDHADVYEFEDGFLKSSDPLHDHITLSVGVNGVNVVPAGNPAGSVSPDQYFGVKIGHVPHTGAMGGAVREFIKPTDAKDWSQGATVYEDGSVLLDQDVFFNGVEIPSNFGGLAVDAVDIFKEPHLNNIDASAPAASWYDSLVGFTIGNGDPVLGTGSMESGDQSDTTAMNLSTLISNGINTDAVSMTANVDDAYIAEIDITGNSTLQSRVSANRLFWLLDSTLWTGDSSLKDFYNSHLVANWPTVMDDSDLLGSVGLGGADSYPIIFSRQAGDSFIYSHDFFDVSPTAYVRYVLPFDIGLAELTSVCTNTNSLKPPLVQGASASDPDVDLQRPNGSESDIAVDLNKGGNGALIGFDRAAKHMWYVDADYASGGVTLSHDETGVLDVRTSTSFAGCDSSNGQQPAVLIKNETSEDVTVISTAGLSRSFTAAPRSGTGVMFSLSMKAGSQGLTGDWATASFEQALTDSGVFSASIADVDAWLRTDDTDLYMRVLDTSTGTMVFQDFSGSLFDTSYTLSGIEDVMYDADTGRVASDQEGFAVSTNGMIMSSFADTLRIGGINNVSEFEEGLPELFSAVNDHDGMVGDVETVNFDYVSSNYPYREHEVPVGSGTIADDFRAKAASLVLK